MAKLSSHFTNTILFAQTAKINLENFYTFSLVADIDDLNQLSRKFNEDISVSDNLYLDALKEIFAIEKEKLVLRDSKKTVKLIFCKEKFLNEHREKLLFLPFEKLKDISLVVNPMIETYESDWKWHEREAFQNLFDIKHNLTINRGDYFFLLEKTGTFDVLLDTNVFEFPLTEYQYFLLRLFNKPKKVKIVLKDFYKFFDIKNFTENIEFCTLTEKIIKELVFRRFIVIPNITKE